MSCGLEAPGEVFRHRGDEIHLAVDDAPHTDDPGAEPIAQGVGDRAETSAPARRSGGDHRDPVDLPEGIRARRRRDRGGQRNQVIA